jgi:hypothetical protein
MGGVPVVTSTLFSADFEALEASVRPAGFQLTGNVNFTVIRVRL